MDQSEAIICRKVGLASVGFSCLLVLGDEVRLATSILAQVEHPSFRAPSSTYTDKSKCKPALYNMDTRFFFIAQLYLYTCPARCCVSFLNKPQASLITSTTNQTNLTKPRKNAGPFACPVHRFYTSHGYNDQPWSSSISRRQTT